MLFLLLRYSLRVALFSVQLLIAKQRLLFCVLSYLTSLEVGLDVAVGLPNGEGLGGVAGFDVELLFAVDGEKDGRCRRASYQYSYGLIIYGLEMDVDILAKFGANHLAEGGVEGVFPTVGVGLFHLLPIGFQPQDTAVVVHAHQHHSAVCIHVGGQIFEHGDVELFVGVAALIIPQKAGFEFQIFAFPLGDEVYQGLRGVEGKVRVGGGLA